MPGLTVWNEDDLTDRGLTLYETLGHAELLLTDHSSVWIDYLLLGRPIVFTIADREDYSASRGHYFTPLEDHLPGPIVETLDDLRAVLTRPVDDLLRTWGPALASSRDVHHRFADGRSSERVVDAVSSRCSTFSSRK
jgi:CDP-glycerol glycerophosphotransferase (TagB/SpsB family)